MYGIFPHNYTYKWNTSAMEVNENINFGFSDQQTGNNEIQYSTYIKRDSNYCHTIPTFLQFTT